MERNALIGKSKALKLLGNLHQRISPQKLENLLLKQIVSIFLI
jgi:hypothetical protein